MRNSNNQTLKDVIRQLMDSYGHRDRLTEVQLVNAWEGLVGKTISRHTREIWIKNSVLYLRLDSSVLREELSYNQEKIIKLVNGYAGREVVTRIDLR